MVSLPADDSEWAVAALDTGVADEDTSDDADTGAPAGTLAASAIVAPMDLVGGDTHTNDDHQHGTHIASIIGSQDDGAFEGQVVGKAPGVWLMPVTVLDEDNAATRST